MTDKRSYKYRVEPHDVDFLRRATVKSMGDYILHAAGEDADRNGFGVRDLFKGNVSWVLSRMAYEVYRLPEEYEHFTIYTWVSEVTRMTTLRNFEVKDSNDKLICAGTSLWAVIDMDTRRPVNISEIELYTNMVQDFPSPIERPERLLAPDVAEQKSLTVLYSDIDFNRHTHSMNYLRWAVDMLPIEELETDRRLRVDINFIKESHFGEELTIKCSAQSPYVFEICDTEQAICRLKIAFT